MKTFPPTIRLDRMALIIMATLGALIGLPHDVSAQCPAPVLTSGLQGPIGSTLSKQERLIVAESGTPTPNTGRLSIVELNGTRRTLLDALPSGFSAEGGEPSGRPVSFFADALFISPSAWATRSSTDRLPGQKFRIQIHPRLS